MPIRILKKDKNKSEPKKRFDPRTGEETNKPGVKDPRTIYRPKSDIETPQMRTGGLSPKQKAIASKAPPPDKIDGKDFAVLKAEKAKGRGMGLQDESVQPGKVMKAKDSKFIERRKKLSNMSEFQKRRLKLESKKMGGVMKAKMGVATDYKKYLKGLKKATDSVKKDKENKFIKRRMKLMGMPKLSKGGGADSGTVGEMKSRIGVAMNKAKRLRSTDRLTERDIEKAKSLVKGKMGGGMIAPSQRPGYSKGTMVKARGCKLGRTRPTKIT